MGHRQGHRGARLPRLTAGRPGRRAPGEPSAGPLVDDQGRTLYAFTKDQGDKSACSGQCAATWPALAGPATAGSGAQAGLLSVAMQADGTSQVTYGGKPLYHFAGDQQAGDLNGQGVGKVWFVVGADGHLVKSAS